MMKPFSTNITVTQPQNSDGEGAVTLRPQVTDLLQRLPGASMLLEIYNGRTLPLSDYLRPVSEDWVQIPPALVNGLTLLPVFTNADWIYCIEPTTGRFLTIDLEKPWPPTETFASGSDFMMHFLRLMQENR